MMQYFPFKHRLHDLVEGLKLWLLKSIFQSILYVMLSLLSFQIKLLSPVPSLFWLLKSWVCSYSLFLNFLAVRPVYVSCAELSPLVTVAL